MIMRVRPLAALPALAVLVALLGGCGVPLLPPGQQATRSHQVPDGVTGVRLEGRGDLQLSTGPAALELTGGENLLDDVRVEVDGSELVLSSDRRWQPQRRGTVTYRLTLPEWDAIRVSGSGSAVAEDAGDAADSPLAVRVSGSGDLDLVGLDRRDVEVSVSGSGDVRLAGTADSVRAEVSGSGDVRAGDLEARDVSARVSGSGAVEVTATDSLSARVSGSGEVTYGGDPDRVDSSTSGSGSVRARR